MRAKSTIPLEISYEGERMSLCYSRQFRCRTIAILFLLSVLAGGILFFPLSAMMRGGFLESITWAVFLLLVGGSLTVWVVLGWTHLAWYGWRCVVFDRQVGTCSIPMSFFRTRGLQDVARVRVERKRLEAATYRNIESPQLWATHNIERDSLWLVPTDPSTKPQRLWGGLGLTTGAESVAEEMAKFIGRKLERRPVRYFARESAQQ